MGQHKWKFSLKSVNCTFIICHNLLGASLAILNKNRNVSFENKSLLNFVELNFGCCKYITQFNQLRYLVNNVLIFHNPEFHTSNCDIFMHSCVTPISNWSMYTHVTYPMTGSWSRKVYIKNTVTGNGIFYFKYTFIYTI